MTPQAPKRVTKTPKARPVRGGNASAKPKMAKEERRAKYTQLARDRSDKRRRQQSLSHVVCYHCRQTGHGVADCPNNKPDKSSIDGQQPSEKQKRKQKKKNQQANTVASKICYKCGSTEHGLHSCPQWKPGDTDLPHCLCFVCHERGHLASQCPQNNHGIFVHGGECKECGSNKHKSKDCPNKKQTDKKKQAAGNNDKEENWDSLLEGKGDEQTESRAVVNETKDVARDDKTTKPRRVVNF